MFQFDEDIGNVDVLFVGINPSYNNEIEDSKFYTKEQALQHKYFKPFDLIEKEILRKYKRQITWSHVDLLVFRETKF